MTFRVGLTGGMGCGKSTVSELFAEYGATVIDSDIISHQLTQAGGAAIEPIRKEFGDDYINAAGALDRPRMRQRVFSDPVAKQRLEAILHPLIRTQMQAQAHASGTAPYQVLVIPLLFETSGYQALIQRSLVVDCCEATQVARAIKRSGLDEQIVRAIMATQLSRAERLQRADDIIQNEGDMQALQQEVKKLHQRYLGLAKGND